MREQTGESSISVYDHQEAISFGREQPMTKKSRDEAEIFADLQKLCGERGFVHAIAAFCFRDNVWGFGDELRAEDVLKQRSSKELIRTEISTLVGLMIKGGVDFSFPGPAAIQSMMDRAEALLDELHHSMMEPLFSAMAEAMKVGRDEINPFGSAAAMREPVFYGGDSAYDFQYLDLAQKKYATDEAWLEANKGFTMQQAVLFASHLQQALAVQLLRELKALRSKHPDTWTMLPGFVFSIDAVVAATGLPTGVVRSIVRAFSDSATEPNAAFQSLGDFNTASSHPILTDGEDTFLLLQSYSLLEAMYESPFYWMIADKAYRNAATAARGRFTESYTAGRLRAVFGDKSVTENVRILDKRGRVLGEIDVLVVFGTRVVIVQTKSKKLTIAARKGNDAAMKADFAGAVQDAYDQAKSCADLLDGDVVLVDAADNPIAIPSGIEVVVPVCVVSDHYPALAFQTRQFLAHKEAGKLVAPFVIDVFIIDVLCELLDSPLFLLSYIERRALYNDKVHSNHELAVLGYHIKSNLWVETDTDMLAMAEDMAADVDVAMIARRTDVPGRRMPPGTLVEFRKGTIGSIISNLERSTDAAKFDLGMMLLTLSERTLSHLNRGIEHAARLTKADGKVHDFTLSIAEGHTGITAHITDEPLFVAGPALEEHCARRKYVSKATTWFGLAIDPKTMDPRTGLELRGEWQQSAHMDASTKEMRPDLKQAPNRIDDKTSFEALIRPLGRNDRCWCGSSLKYKKCHLDSDSRAKRRRELR